MTGEEKKRAILDFGNFDTLPPPAIDIDVVKAVTRAAGFRETPKAVVTETRTPRRTRRKTGRTEQFSTRIRADILQKIYTYADQHEITLSETLERAIKALFDENEGHQHGAIQLKRLGNPA